MPMASWLGVFYPLTASANWNDNDLPELARPQTAIKGTVTTTLFAPRADSTSAYLVEDEFTVLRDVEIADGKVVVYQAPWVKEAEVFQIACKDGRSFCGKLDRRKSRVFGSLDDPDYVPGPDESA